MAGRVFGRNKQILLSYQITLLENNKIQLVLLEGNLIATGFWLDGMRLFLLGAYMYDIGNKCLHNYTNGILWFSRNTQCLFFSRPTIIRKENTSYESFVLWKRIKNAFKKRRALPAWKCFFTKHFNPNLTSNQNLFFILQEDDEDFDLPRRPFRRRAMSVSSRLSTSSISSTVRPLPAPTPSITPDYSPESPLIMDKQVYKKYSFKYIIKTLGNLHLVLN